MNELLITINGSVRQFPPGATARIGRNSDNDIVVGDPTVSRQHAQISWEASGWVWRNAGHAPTFIAGQQVTDFALSQPVTVNLATPQGPALHLQVTAAQQPAPAAAAMPPGMGPGTGAGPVPPGMPGHQPDAGPSGDMGSALHILVPIRSWLTDPGLRQGLRLLVIPYALLPLVFLQLFGSSTSLATPGWVYSLYVAPLWLMAFWAMIRPGRIGRTEAMLAVGIVIWTVIWLNTVTIAINDTLPQPLTLPTAMVVGFNEETTKALPVLLAALALLKFRHSKLDARMWMLLGTIAGLTFGVVEQSLYTPSAIISVHAANMNSQAVSAELLFTFRVFVDGFQHAVWAGITGFFVGMAVNYRRRRVLLLLLGLCIAAVLHGLNDWSLTVIGVWGGAVVQAVSLLLFLGYTLSAGRIERQVRRNPAFRGQSILMDSFSESQGTA
ncbi:MAG: PrsW family glutamic-type intramembrane protease [Streptosporangiaceae bacterium]